jgi:hypothetical protein
LTASTASAIIDATKTIATIILPMSLVNQVNRNWSNPGTTSPTWAKFSGKTMKNHAAVMVNMTAQMNSTSATMSFLGVVAFNDTLTIVHNTDA